MPSLEKSGITLLLFSGAECRAQGEACQVNGAECRAQGEACKVNGAEYRAQEEACKVVGANKLGKMAEGKHLLGIVQREQVKSNPIKI